MNSWVKSIIAGVVMTGIVLLFYKKVIPLDEPGLYKVHYVLGSMQQPNTGTDILGEIPAIIKKRISELGYNSIIRVVRNNKLDIQVENVIDTISLRHAIIQNSKNRKIEFRELYTLDELPGFFSVADKAADKVFESAKIDKEGIYSLMSPLISEEVGDKSVFPSAIALVNKKDTAILSRVLHEPYLLKTLPEDLQFYFGKLTEERQILNTPDDLCLYAIKTRGQAAILKNDNIANARVASENYDGSSQIFIELDNNGKARWAKMTENNVDRYIAVILDDIVVMAHRIYGPMLEGNILLNGRFTNEEATTLAQQLATGYVPVELTIIKQEISLKNIHKGGNLTLILLLSFILTGGIAFLIFNSLKNR